MNTSLKEDRQAPTKMKASPYRQSCGISKQQGTRHQKAQGEKDMVDVMKDRIKEDRLENAKKMIADGNIPIEKIAYFQGLPLSEVQRIAEEVKARSETE